MHDTSQFVPARFSRGAAIAWLAILPFSFELRAQDHSGETMEYSDKPYQSLIAKYAVADGDGVDYAAWQASAEDMAAMDDFIRLIGHVSPTSHPELFPSQDRAKSYWINAYNALVLDAVLDHWPLDSVRDVTVSLSSRILPGKGFFYDQDVVVGGEVTNLKKLEEHVLESLDDPRLHFALNCASESCPVLRASDWSDAELDQAARDFVNNIENVEVADGRLVLSRIFKWYKKDFPRDIASYLKNYAGPGLEAQLAVAIAEDYPVTYRDYDWSLNASGGE
jgi:hypothetical protein